MITLVELLRQFVGERVIMDPTQFEVAVIKDLLTLCFADQGYQLNSGTRVKRAGVFY